MGMAASQARLLALTARIHDVEYQAQAIQNAKMGLANLSDQAYNDYLAALDAQTLTVKDYEGNAIVASFNTLCSKNAVQPAGDFKYALKDSKGHLIVSDDIKAKYDEFMAQAGYADPYAFAMFMTTGKDAESIKTTYNYALYNVAHNSENPDIIKQKDKLDDMWGKICDAIGIPVPTSTSMEFGCSRFYVIENLETTNTDEEVQALIKEYKEVEDTLKFRVFKSSAADVFNDGSFNSELDEAMESDFNYYVGIFKQIQASGGCVSIADYDGVNGDAANDSDWLENMLKCGKITIDTATFDKTNGAVKFTATGVSSDTYLEYATTSSIDKKELAKAEAEYEHACHDIDQKDKKFDLDLTRLETERNALTTEYDSVKKVIQENIERTFGIFS